MSNINTKALHVMEHQLKQYHKKRDLSLFHLLMERREHSGQLEVVDMG